MVISSKKQKKAATVKKTLAASAAASKALPSRQGLFPRGTTAIIKQHGEDKARRFHLTHI